MAFFFNLESTFFQPRQPPKFHLADRVIKQAFVAGHLPRRIASGACDVWRWPCVGPAQPPCWQAPAGASQPLSQVQYGVMWGAFRLLSFFLETHFIDCWLPQAFAAEPSLPFSPKHSGLTSAEFASMVLPSPDSAPHLLLPDLLCLCSRAASGLPGRELLLMLL